MFFIDALSHITDTNVEFNTSTGVTMTQVKKQQMMVVREQLPNHHFLVAPLPLPPYAGHALIISPQICIPNNTK